MPFTIIREDITRMSVDAIVNTANPYPSFGRGTDSAIYQAAGSRKLLKEREKIGLMEVGQAAITPAFNLNAKYIIHTVGPRWRGGDQEEAVKLRACYQNCFALARKKRLKSMAFPLISTGNYGFPKDLALSIVLEEVDRILNAYEMMIYLTVFDQDSVTVSEKLYQRVESYIDDDYWEQKEIEEYVAFDELPFHSREKADAAILYEPLISASLPAEKTSGRKLSDILGQQNETFSQMLLRLIREKGLTNAQAYTRSNQSKKLFSKIKNNIHYQPNKKTVMAFALGLELNLDETRDLLARAGYAFSPSNDFDRVIQFFIESGQYNIYEIEIVLYDLGLDTLCNYS